MRTDLPPGTVTFLFTDIEGSTKLLDELGAAEYAVALSEHRRAVRESCTAQGGVEVDTVRTTTSSRRRTRPFLEQDKTNNTAWVRFTLSNNSTGNRKVTATGTSPSSGALCGDRPTNR